MNEKSLDIVTGGAGFIGSHLVDRLIAEGSRVRVIDNLISGQIRNIEQHKNNSNFELIVGDVSDHEWMKRSCKNAHRIFHLAARAEIVPSIVNPLEYYRANVDGTLSMLEAARKNKIKRFIYIASSSSYGFPEVIPTPETAKICPQYPYALTKYLGEELTLHWHKVYHISAVSLRLFNVYGPRARTSSNYGAVFGVFLAQLLSGKPLTVVGDGSQARDFTYISDVIDAIFCAANGPVDGEIFNVGSGREPVSIHHLVKLLGAEKTILIPKRPGEPDITWADIRKIQTTLKWQAKITMEEGVKIMLDHINDWRDAPVWTPDTIANATSMWFNYLPHVSTT